MILDYILANWMDVLGTTLGLLYIWLEIRENLWMWVVGSVMPVIYIFVLYRAGLYADCGMEVYYFLAGIYGLFCWLTTSSRSSQGGEKATLAISRLRDRERWEILSVMAVTLILWVAMGIFLRYCTDSTVPVLDAFTTALSIVGLWMLSRKYLEQWWVWMVVDAVSVGLYIYKGVYGRALLYSIYTVIAVYGYFQWKKRMALQADGTTAAS